ncbi:DUF4156 domain-containing protein [Simiduia sp. 21SJ11W-1]|uniref:DUF4156 domain-containing protein n=1 Tax=Simiduia sp. 21SJ11W-1 TaxID=2909669 RepID=UPI0020A21F58|nr:DUF4156 domain-containing protein [Simiduia sp. 21SJ11W-1]UTA46808.1 DUF4156 domain-containing protein [Simiduia sp. 21SJ11W-1]
MKISSAIVLVLMTVLVSGCIIMDGNAIVLGESRNALSKESVKIYRSAPENFEEIALVNSSAGHDFKSDSDLMNAALERLKEEAAKVGANGVILTEIKERDRPVVVTSYGSATATVNGSSAYATGNAVGVSRGDTYTRLKGVAIFVQPKS